MSVYYNPYDYLGIDISFGPNGTNGADRILLGGIRSTRFDEVHGLDGNDFIRAGYWMSTSIYGDGGDDILLGNEGGNELYGGAGDDVIEGGYLGLDRLDGGAGNDILIIDSNNRTADWYHGGDGIDTLSVYGRNDRFFVFDFENIERIIFTDNVRSMNMLTMQNADLSKIDSNDDILGGTLGTISSRKYSATITGTNRIDTGDTIFTYEGEDVVNGVAGDDTISSGAGNDIINGGVGDDILTGGSGNDIFQFAFPSSDSEEIGVEYDVISDFSDGLDMIEFQNSAGKSFADLTLTQLSPELSTIAYGNDVIALQGITISQITEADITFI